MSRVSMRRLLDETARGGHGAGLAGDHGGYAPAALRETARRYAAGGHGLPVG